MTADTKAMLADILSRVDTDEARETVTLYRSDWTFTFCRERDAVWSEDRTVQGFLDQDEVVMACLNAIPDIVSGPMDGTWRVEISNATIGFECRLRCAYGEDNEPEVLNIFDPEHSDDEGMRP